MPKPVPLPPPGFDELSVDQKIDYLQEFKCVEFADELLYGRFRAQPGK